MARILVVEDEPDIALLLEDDLAAEGHQVEVVSDGDAAVQRGKEPGLDLIVLDVMLREKTASTSAATCAAPAFARPSSSLRPRRRRPRRYSVWNWAPTITSRSRSAAGTSCAHQGGAAAG